MQDLVSPLLNSLHPEAGTLNLKIYTPNPKPETHQPPATSHYPKPQREMGELGREGRSGTFSSAKWCWCDACVALRRVPSSPWQASSVDRGACGGWAWARRGRPFRYPSRHPQPLLWARATWLWHSLNGSQRNVRTRPRPRHAPSCWYGNIFSHL